MDNYRPRKYNSLPYILENETVPALHQQDIEDLKSLFRKHNVPHGILLKLVHKHFNIDTGEVMVHREIAVPTEGAVSIMGPMETKKRIPLTGLNHTVDNKVQLQCYEYIIVEQPALSHHHAFLVEFCKFIIERGLQRKLGLRIGLPEDLKGWTEFEIAEKRGTIMVPQRAGLPEFDNENSVTTEWEADRVFASTCVGHCNGHQHVYKGHHPTIEPLPPSGGDDDTSRTNDWFLAGIRLEVGYPLQLIVSTAISKL